MKTTIVNTSMKNIKPFFENLCMKLSHLLHSCRSLLSSFHNNLVLQFFLSLPSFCIHLAYFIFFSIIGFFLLKVSSSSSSRLDDLDLFFTSVSAVSVSSMSTVEMEVFSDFQLVVLTILMLVGGEVFISLLKLQFSNSMFSKNHLVYGNSSLSNHSPSNPKNITDFNQIELGLVQINDHSCKHELTSKSEEEESNYVNKSFKYLSYAVATHFLAAHVLGSFLISFYINSVQSAKQILENKGIKVTTFSVFTAVSSFSNCGFIPTNENMMVFKKHTGLLLITLPQCLVGNTLYPACLLIVIYILKTCTKKPEFGYILSNYNKLGYCHLMSKKKCCYLATTVLGCILIQLVIFVSMEWNNPGAMEGLNSYEKLVASLFQVTNARHTGESVFDLSTISPAVLVVFIIMMYLSPYTTFIPDGEKEGPDFDDNKTLATRKTTWVEYLRFSEPVYLTMFIVVICISERNSLKDDPLNFSVLNIIMEVISAYGNVGFSMGYSCERRIKSDGQCKDAYIGFVGRWSHTGKWILIIVMLFGRLKYFHKGGGKAWKLL
ncbi:sodium transporter HKT1-like [Apium graveolens]|uniref:sodium transporter HKT1-like n=1 Tax=Apium graveolens TaxID=4045 RepID=UPI003D79D8F8